MTNLPGLLKSITTFALDMDGVLTDGTVWAFANGEQVRRMSVRDGYALRFAINKGYNVIILSGSFSEGARIRLQKLGISNVFMNIENKLETLTAYKSEHGLSWEEILFIGDDIPDIEVMKQVGVSCAPADALPEIRAIAKSISPYKGGEGCVRDIIEKVLKIRGDWEVDTKVVSG